MIHLIHPKCYPVVRTGQQNDTRGGKTPPQQNELSRRNDGLL